jgi:hypothetical protein
MTIVNFLSKWDSFSEIRKGNFQLVDWSQNQQKNHCELVTKIEKCRSGPWSQNGTYESTLEQKPRASEELSVQL